MSRRVDSAEYRRMSTLQGDALDLAPDPMLQQIAAQAVAVTNTSWSAINLLLRQTLVVRAHHNLPRELVGLLSFDGGGALCSDVVRSGKRIVVGDVPPHDTSNVLSRAYYGEPVLIDDVVVGVLCVNDSKPRDFQGNELADLATLAGHRLAVLSERREPSRRLLDLALRPAFAEIRNDLTPLQADLVVAQETLQRLRADAASARMQALKSIEAMMESLVGLQRTTRRLSENLSSLQVMCCGADRAIVREVVQASDELAYHHTNLVGGVTWTVNAPTVALDVSQRTSVSVLTASLSVLALRLGATNDRNGLQGQVDKVDASVLVRFGANLDTKTLRQCATAVSDLIDSPQIAITSGADAFQIVLPAA